MRALLIGLVLVALSVSSVAIAQQAPHLAAKQALVLIETNTGTGSGFAINATMVATACHVIIGITAIRLNFWATKTAVPGRQLLCNERRDVGVISTQVPSGTLLLEFVTAKPNQGDQVWVWGYPGGTEIALEPSVASGIVSATETAEGFIVVDSAGAPGSSGGPVVNAEGKVVAIFTSSWIAGRQGATGFKYAAPGWVALTLIPSASGSPPPATASAAEGAIRPGEGVAPIKLGMTPAEAEAAMGLPPTTRDPQGWWEWATRKLVVHFDRGKIDMIYTENNVEATTLGIRIGATDTDLITAYGRPLCSNVMNFRGKALLTWLYEGIWFFLAGTPRAVNGIVIIPNGVSSQVCK